MLIKYERTTISIWLHNEYIPTYLMKTAFIRQTRSLTNKITNKYNINIRNTSFEEYRISYKSSGCQPFCPDLSDGPLKIIILRRVSPRFTAFTNDLTLCSPTGITFIQLTPRWSSGLSPRP